MFKRPPITLYVLVASIICLLGTTNEILASVAGVTMPTAQFQRDQQAEADAKKACAACGGCGATVIVAVVALIALNIALLVWVARDAKSRGMDSAALWMLLVMFTGLIGLIIYFFSRPQGELIQCPNCRNKRLLASVKCPHCGWGNPANGASMPLP